MASSASSYPCREHGCDCGEHRGGEGQLPSQFLLKDMASEQEHAAHLQSLHDYEARRKQSIQQRIQARIEYAKNDFKNDNWTSIRKKLVDARNLWEAEFDRAADLVTKLEEVQARLEHEEAMVEIVETKLEATLKLNAALRESLRAQLIDAEEEVSELLEALSKSEAIREAQEIRRNEERIASTNPRKLTHECNICCNAESDALFPCGHVFCCTPCAHGINVEDGKDCAICPVCRADGPFKKIHFC